MQFMQIAVIQMGSMFELNKVFLKVYTASTFLSHFLR